MSLMRLQQSCRRLRARTVVCWCSSSKASTSSRLTSTVRRTPRHWTRPAPARRAPVAVLTVIGIALVYMVVVALNRAL